MRGVRPRAIPPGADVSCPAVPGRRAGLGDRRARRRSRRSACRRTTTSGGSRSRASPRRIRSRRRGRSSTRSAAPVRPARSGGERLRPAWCACAGGKIGLSIPGLDHHPEVPLDDYLDRPGRGHERGVPEVRGRRRLPEARVLEAALRPGRADAAVGGGGRALPRHDGSPGPRDVGAGQLPEGDGEASGRGRELVRGRRVRRVRGQEPSHDLPLEPGRADGGQPPHRSGKQLLGRRAPSRSEAPAPSAASARPTWPATSRSGAGTRAAEASGTSSAEASASRRTCSSTRTRSPRGTAAELRLPVRQVLRAAAGRRAREARARRPRLLEGEARLGRRLPRLQGPLRVRQGAT